MIVFDIQLEIYMIMRAWYRVNRNECLKCAKVPKVEEFCRS